MLRSIGIAHAITIIAMMTVGTPDCIIIRMRDPDCWHVMSSDKKVATFCWGVFTWRFHRCGLENICRDLISSSCRLCKKVAKKKQNRSDVVRHLTPTPSSPSTTPQECRLYSNRKDNGNYRGFRDYMWGRIRTIHAYAHTPYTFKPLNLKSCRFSP